MHEPAGLEGKALATLARYRMVQPEERVLVALSGGADSVALLSFLQGQTAVPLTLYALHLHHGIRGEEADRDAAFCQAFCCSRGVPLTLLRADIPTLARQRGQSVELCAREERYRLLEAEADRLGAKIATAHTLSDAAETLLLNLARGTGLQGLCGIPPVRGRIIRPLLGCTRQEVEAYCAAQGLAYVTDSTNRSEAYSRNRLRLRVLPELAALNPGLLPALARTMEHLQDDQQYLTQQAAALRARAARGERLDAALLAAAPPALRRRVLLALLEEADAAVDSRKVALCEDCCVAGSGAVTLHPGLRFAVGGGLAGLERAEALPPPSAELLPVAPGGSYRLSGKNIQITLLGREQYEHFAKSAKNGLKNQLDYDKIKGKVILRTRRPGDAIALPGRGGTKTLKKLLNEARVPLPQRGRLLLLCDEQGPCWLEGFGPAVRVQAGAYTQRFLFVQTWE